VEPNKTERSSPKSRLRHEMTSIQLGLMRIGGAEGSKKGGGWHSGQTLKGEQAPSKGLNEPPARQQGRLTKKANTRSSEATAPREKEAGRLRSGKRTAFGPNAGESEPPAGKQPNAACSCKAAGTEGKRTAYCEVAERSLHPLRLQARRRRMASV
jgi:hypothetical protein